jgi:lysozyme
MTILSSIDKLIEYNEGRRYACYDDAHPDRILKAGDHCEGTPTIGVGCTGPDIVPGLVWTDAQIDAAKADRIALAMRRACLDLGPDCWSKLDIVRQAVLVDMAYQMGGAGLAKFKNMLSAIRTGDWLSASDALLDSTVARSQAPEREERNAEMLLRGAWPEVA